MKDYRLGDAAESELVDALVAHERRWAKAGRNLYAEFQAAFDAIRRHPQAFPDAGGGARMYAMTPAPFVIYYFDLPMFVWVAAIPHKSRRLGYWRRRKPPRV